MTATAVVPWWRPGDSIEPLRSLLVRGGVLAIPTESSYGLGVDPRNRDGVEAVYRIKLRDAGKPLPVVMADRCQLGGLGIDPDLPILARLEERCWPGAVSVVVPLKPAARDLPATAGTRALAVRVPDHPLLLRLLRQLEMPLTATSANLSGEEPVLDPQGAAAMLAGEEAAVIDGGRLPGGPPSTLIAEGPRGLRILRPGRVSEARLRALLESPAPG